MEEQYRPLRFYSLFVQTRTFIVCVSAYILDQAGYDRGTEDG